MVVSSKQGEHNADAKKPQYLLSHSGTMNTSIVVKCFTELFKMLKLELSQNTYFVLVVEYSRAHQMDHSHLK